MDTQETSTGGLDQLKTAGQELMRTLGDRALDTVDHKLSGLTDRISNLGQGGGPIGEAVAAGGAAAVKGENPLLGGLKGGLKGAFGGIKDRLTGGGEGEAEETEGDATSSTNIIESVDVGVPISVAYNQWTEFSGFPSFMKKVENVDAEEDQTLTFKAQIFLSHRTWEATILEQIPDERIVWRSKGQKGHVDGAVSFHELAPNLTRILMVLEYYPQGLFEKTGNLWRAQGRRARAELRHFARQVMTRTILEPEEVEGWRGVIRDGEVVETHEDHVERELQEEDEDYDEGEEDESAGEDQYDEGEEDEYDEGEGDEYDESEDQGDEDESAEEDEYDEGEEDEYDESEDQGDEDEDQGDEDESADEDEYDEEDQYDESEDQGDEDEDDESADEDEYDEEDQYDEDDESADEDEDQYDESEDEDEDDYDEEEDAEDEEAQDEPPRRGRGRRGSR